MHFVAYHVGKRCGRPVNGIIRIMVLLVCVLVGTAAGDNRTVLRTELSGIPWDASALHNSSKAIYGTDDRIDVYEETDGDRRAWAASTCAIVYARDLTAVADDMYTLDTYAYLVLGKPACDGESFADQPTASFCSAFVVGRDLIATAGHCFDGLVLSDMRFLFGFEMANATTPVTTFHRNQIYAGVEILSCINRGDNDHAVVRVDRPIIAPDAHPLPLQLADWVRVGENIGVIGHPSGLPKKISFGADTIVRESKVSGYFIANLDTYSGNSGSPVFNAATGLVEGILVSGARDFIVESSCFRSQVYPDTGGIGEKVTRSTVLVAFVPQLLDEGEGEDAWQPVPNLYNLASEGVAVLLDNHGFVLGDVAQQYHETIAPGRIISQTPEAGTLAPPGAVVGITVSLGSQYVSVPDLYDTLVSEIEAILLNADLAVGVVDEVYHPDLVKDHVISQDPAAGSEVARQTPVNIKVSTGPAPDIDDDAEPKGCRRRTTSTPDDTDENEGESDGGGNKQSRDEAFGCCNAQGERVWSLKSVEQMLGDWLLLGLALLVLAKMRV